MIKKDDLRLIRGGRATRPASGEFRTYWLTDYPAQIRLQNRRLMESRERARRDIRAIVRRAFEAGPQGGA